MQFKQFGGDDSDDDWEYTPKGISDKDFEENIDYLKSHPLFMKELPKDFDKNENITALQNLVYDDEPIKVAKHLNDKGNEILKKGDHKYYTREAIKSYDEALTQEFEDNELKARIHSNRSLANYKLKNFGKAVEDAKEAIKLNPTFIKPYYRCAQAYLTLHKFEDCIKIAEEGLKVSSDCKEIINLKKDAENQLERFRQQEAQKGQAMNQKQLKLIESFKSRGYVLGKKRIHEIPNAHEMEPFVDSDGFLKFATIVTYLEFGQMDFIQKVSEDDYVADHLKEIFKEKLPWDEKGYYSYGDLAIFVELNCVEPMYNLPQHTNFERSFYRISRKKKFSDIMKTNGYVMPFIFEIYVVSRSSPFFNKFKQEFDITRTV